MHWRITLEAVDPTGEEYRREFLVEKSLDDLLDGCIGCSIDDGKAIMAEIQKAVVQRELDLWVRCRRVCQSCGNLLPIKDYQERKILTVFGAAPVTYPRLIICQKCNPWTCFTFSLAADLCPDRATPELMELSARLGSRLSYREASDIVSTFLPCHLSRKFTTIRNRALTVGKRIEKAERDRLWHERLDHADRTQLELPLEGDAVGRLSSASILRISPWSGIGAVGHSRRLLATAAAADGEMTSVRSLRLREHIRLS